MSKTYRTANGGKVDLGSLILSQENTRSVGNMGVNARGDKINSRNEVIESRNEIVQHHYNKAHSPVVEEAPIPTSAKHAEELAGKVSKVKKTTATKKPKPKAKEVKEEILPVASEEKVAETTEPIIKQEEVMSIPKSSVPQGGLAAAIAKAKQIKEEENKTPRQQEQEKKGVTKL
jgi:hypothetical protein